jgi:hypothetical protein
LSRSASANSFGLVWIEHDAQVKISVADMAHDWGWQERDRDVFLRFGNAFG